MSLLQTRKMGPHLLEEKGKSLEDKSHSIILWKANCTGTP